MLTLNSKLKHVLRSRIADLRSCKQRQRYFSFFCNRRIMAAWSVQSNSSRSYLYSCSSIIFVIHHYDYPHQLYINDNAVVTSRRVNRVSISVSFLLVQCPTFNQLNLLMIIRQKRLFWPIFVPSKLTFRNYFSLPLKVLNFILNLIVLRRY